MNSSNPSPHESGARKPCEELELAAPIPGGELAAPAPPALSVGQMLQATIEKGVTAENVAVLERMMDLYERTQAKDAEKEFARAFNALQAEMPSVKAVKPVPDKLGNIKYYFAPYEEIMTTVRPLLLKHGFTLSFSMTFNEGRVIQECTLQHTSGHAKKNSFAVRIGHGPPGASEAQADGAAGTYAKRHALCNALNIIIEQDSDGVPDARSDGAFISVEQALYLKELIKETKSDEPLFLKYAQALKVEEIGTSRYDDCVRMLMKKRNAPPK